MIDFSGPPGKIFEFLNTDLKHDFASVLMFALSDPAPLSLLSYNTISNILY